MKSLVRDQWRIQDFPEVGAPTLGAGRQHKILPNFPINCMKLKEFGPLRASLASPLDPPMVTCNLVYNISLTLAF